MMRISELKIQEIQNKAEIVSVISKYTNLQKKGQDYIGLCLFHQDSNPSMSVSPAKKIFKCFSCGVGGNAFEFLMKYRNLSFLEAAVELAEEFHIDLGQINLAPKKEKYSDAEKKIFEINQEAMKYYQVNLNAELGTLARKYLENRKIEKDQISQWEVGYALGDEIVKHLTAIGYTTKDIVAAGLATQKDNGTFDYFNNRIVFPIKNLDGHVIGFSGRVLTDEKPKYLNTRETLVFKKTNILFNLDRVWKIKERLESVILLEGFMDVISLEKVNIHNSMAIMGTAFSKYHLQILKEIKKPVKLFLDGDEAGFNAMYQIAKILLANNLKFSIIDNVTNQDPDELVNQGQTSQILKMIDEPVNPYEYFLNKMLAGQEKLGFDQVEAITNKIMDLLKYETNYILVDKVIETLTTKLAISKEALTKTFEINNQPKTFEKPKVFQKPVRETKTKKWDKYDTGRTRIFISLLKSDEYVAKVEPLISEFSTNNLTYEIIFKKLIDFYKTKKYHGNDLKTFLALLDQENLDQETRQEIKKMLEHENFGFTNEIVLNETEFSNIIDMFEDKKLTDELKWINNETINLEKQWTSSQSEPEKQIIKQKIASNINKSNLLNKKRAKIQKKKEQ